MCPEGQLPEINKHVFNKCLGRKTIYLQFFTGLFHQTFSFQNTMPRGNCNLNCRLETGCFQTGHFEKPRFPCSELLRLDLTHL